VVVKRWLFVAAGCALGCRDAAPPPQPVASEFQEVPYPPPPAQVEETTAELAGRPECRWIDGHYEFRGRKWQWARGDWVIPPAGCSYAPRVLAWGADRQLYYTPPRWYRADGKTTCQAPPSCRPPAVEP